MTYNADEKVGKKAFLRWRIIVVVPVDKSSFELNSGLLSPQVAEARGTTELSR